MGNKTNKEVKIIGEIDFRVFRFGASIFHTTNFSIRRPTVYDVTTNDNDCQINYQVPLEILYLWLPLEEKEKCFPKGYHDCHDLRHAHKTRVVIITAKCDWIGNYYDIKVSSTRDIEMVESYALK